jgi:hypothetical protein
MDNLIYGILSLLGVFAFVFGLAFLSRKAVKKKQQKLRRELEGLFPMFKLHFEEYQEQDNKLISEPLLVLKRRVTDWLILILVVMVFIFVAIFMKDSSKVLLLSILGIVSVFFLIRSSNYVKIYENGLIYGNLLRKKMIWFDAIDTIEACLYDYGRENHIDVTKDYSRIYRVYELKRKDKVIYEIHETEFKKARQIETCFNINSPLIKQISESSI